MFLSSFLPFFQSQTVPYTSSVLSVPQIISIVRDLLEDLLKVMGLSIWLYSWLKVYYCDIMMIQSQVMKKKKICRVKESMCKPPYAFFFT